MQTTQQFDANIENLTSLWKAMGVHADESAQGSTLYASLNWPHRLWFDVRDPLGKEDARRWMDAAPQHSQPVVLPVWCRDGEPNLDASVELEAAGYEVLFEQTVMSLDLSRWEPGQAGESDLELRKVTGDTSTWAQLASSAFGYTVEEPVTERILDHAGVDLMTALRDGRAVGTGLLFTEGGTAGIHLVGVPPEARRMGIARKIMFRLLDEARARGMRLATLQASAMGEGLYRELGFEAQGHVRNYQLPLR